MKRRLVAVGVVLGVALAWRLLLDAPHATPAPEMEYDDSGTAVVVTFTNATAAPIVDPGKCAHVEHDVALTLRRGVRSWTARPLRACPAYVHDHGFTVAPGASFAVTLEALRRNWSPELPSPLPAGRYHLTIAHARGLVATPAHVDVLVRAPESLDVALQGVAWSKDSSRLAVVVARSGRAGIGVLDVARGTLARVRLESLLVGSVAWSPDGGALAVQRLIAGNAGSGLWLVPLEGAPRLLAPVTADAVAWTEPERIAFAGWHEGDGLYAVDPASGAVTRLSATRALPPGLALDGAVSPDGRTSLVVGRRRLALRRADGTTLTFGTAALHELLE